MVGLYDHRIVYGQERVLITWTRLILLSASSLSLKDGMPGTDALGAAGFHDQVNNPGDLYEALVAYAAYYRAVHGEAIELWALPIQMLSTFLDADREFHAWRRRAGWSRGMGSSVTAGLRSLDSKIKGEGRTIPKCAQLLSGGRPSASTDAILPSRPRAV